MKLLSVREYADKIGVKRQAIESRRRNGTVEYIELNGLHYIDIDKFPPVKGRAGRPSAAAMLLKSDVQKRHTKTVPK